MNQRALPGFRIVVRILISLGHETQLERRSASQKGWDKIRGPVTGAVPLVAGEKPARYMKTAFQFDRLP